jgi:hypothetical protein
VIPGSAPRGQQRSLSQPPRPPVPVPPVPVPVLTHFSTGLDIFPMGWGSKVLIQYRYARFA